MFFIDLINHNLDLSLFSKIASDNNIFSNKKLFEQISSFGEDELLIFFIYKINFEKIKSHVDKFVSSIIENSSTIPYIVKCLCKIIQNLISKKVLIFNYFYFLLKSHCPYIK